MYKVYISIFHGNTTLILAKKVPSLDQDSKHLDGIFLGEVSSGEGALGNIYKYYMGYHSKVWVKKNFSEFNGTIELNSNKHIFEFNGNVYLCSDNGAWRISKYLTIHKMKTMNGTKTRTLRSLSNNPKYKRINMLILKNKVSAL